MSTNNLILLVVLGCSFIGATVIVLITVLSPKTDNNQLIGMTIAFLVPTMTSLIDIVKTNQVKKRLDNLHTEIRDSLSTTPKDGESK